jgi:uncharacterized protein (TIGR04222 family)
MNAQQQALWTALRDFAFDPPGVAFTFANRLARENGWSEAYARRVIDEYRRFLFVARTAGHPVTPSEDVDQAWHLHLTYSRSYWDELCGKVLGHPFHHGPTQGGDAEAAKFHSWYADTLASYRAWFGAAPPPDIWPAPRARFRDAASFVRVNRRRVWVIPKPRRSGLVGACLLAVVALLATGCGRDVFLTFGGPWDFTGGQFLLLYWSLFFATLTAALVVRHAARGPGPRVWEEPEVPDAYETAYLSGYRPRALEAVLASLLHRGNLMFNPNARTQIVAADPPPADAHWWEHEVYNYVQGRHAVTHNDMRFSGVLRQKSVGLEQRLTALGCLLPAGRSLWIRFCTSALFLLLLGFGASKIYVGMARGRPVGFLIASCVVTAIVAVALLFWSTRRTRRGVDLLRQLRERNADYEDKRVTSETPAVSVASAVALFGPPVLIGSALHYLPDEFLPFHQRNQAASGDGGAGGAGGGCGGDGGGGCGGGGCGGGCGGCGGGG